MITIRKAKESDALRLSELLVIMKKLHHDGRPDIYSEGGSKYEISEIKSKIKSKNEVILVAVDDNDFVTGYTMSVIKECKNSDALVDRKYLYLDDLCVDDKFQHLGIGKMLINETIKQAKKENCYNLELNVWAFNQNAIDFYKACGLNEQRIIMEKIL